MARTITVELTGYVRPKLRPNAVRALSWRMQPESITDAWYAANCPRDFKARKHGISFRDWFVWRVACFLRGCRA